LSPSSAAVAEEEIRFVPLTCWKCRRRRQERKELIMEIVETEMKYGRDLHIVQEEFHRPMLVAGLLTPEQLNGVFLNLPELRDWNSRFTTQLRDALEIAIEQGDEDLMTVNLGRIFLQASPMVHAFETYCLRHSASSLLLSNLEKEKELLRIFLKVSQMENTLLRRMNLSSFLMVPVQRVTKYPLLLARLHKVTPHHLKDRQSIKEAQVKMEAHLEHINTEAKEMGATKLWRRISIINAANKNRQNGAGEPVDQVGNIRLRKLAMNILEWSPEHVHFAFEGRLSFTQAGDNMWTRRGKHVKLTNAYALLAIKGNLTEHYNQSGMDDSGVMLLAKRKGIEQAALILASERNNTRYTLIRVRFPVPYLFPAGKRVIKICCFCFLSSNRNR
jgi:hypothetical protein